VVALSEALYFGLQQVSPQVGVSVLCPGWVRTHIVDSDRNRPGGGWGPDQNAAPMRESAHRSAESGADPAWVAGEVVAAVRSGRFYVLTHRDLDDQITSRAEQIVSGGPPAAVGG
jgi:hypothetical protein